MSELHHGVELLHGQNGDYFTDTLSHVFQRSLCPTSELLFAVQLPFAKEIWIPRHVDDGLIEVVSAVSQFLNWVFTGGLELDNYPCDVRTQTPSLIEDWTSSYFSYKFAIHVYPIPN